MSLKSDLLLYAVTDRRWLEGRSLKDVVDQALKGGATAIQLREKDLDDESFKEEALDLKKICDSKGVPLFVNDRVEIAEELGILNVHIGQSDMELKRARRILGQDAIIGVSAANLEEALVAEKNGADYLGVGAVFPTGSKDDARQVSYDTLKEICSKVSIPVVAIGGINIENISDLKGTGISGVAVISAIFAADDIKGASADLRIAVEEITG